MNVKAGDLAILVKANSMKSVGKICQVERFLGRVAWPDATWDNVWSITFSRPIETQMLGSDGKMHTHYSKLACAPDEWLKPISGLSDDEDTIVIKELEVQGG